ncbi:hypothetical protein [Carnimonas bestiolae]
MKDKRYAAVALVAAIASLLIQGFIELHWLPRFLLSFGVVGMACYIAHSLLRNRPSQPDQDHD